MPVDPLLRRATPEEQFAEVTRATVDLHVAEELKSKLRRSYDGSVPLLVKVGFDPSRPDLHLGHTLLLTRMRRFQDFGHRVVFLIGDFTALIGDPTGKNVTRPTLSRDEVRVNAATYQAQVFKVLDPGRTEIRFNSEWLDALGSEGLIRLAARYPLARMLERDDFKTRFREGRSIAMHELLYPLLQGYDSVALKADVELGATDQLFNLLVGRQLMREGGQEPQVVLTGPLLEGLDGKQKMSKSLDNYVGIDESSDDMFGKIMSISDDLMWRYLELLSSVPLPELTARKDAVGRGALHPKQVKVNLAKELVARFHSAAAATAAANSFDARFSKKQLDPSAVPHKEISLQGAASMKVARLTAEAGLTASLTEARKLMAQGGVRLNGEKVTDTNADAGPGEYLLQVGKLKAAQVKLS